MSSFWSNFAGYAGKSHEANPDGLTSVSGIEMLGLTTLSCHHLHSPVKRQLRWTRPSDLGASLTQEIREEKSKSQTILQFTHDVHALLGDETNTDKPAWDSMDVLPAEIV